jgi:hypothetical protein
MTYRAKRSHPLRREDVEVRTEGRRAYLSSPGGRAMFELDALGTAIWDQCDGETSIDEIVAALRQVFDVPQAVVDQDVAELIGRFEAAGLVTMIGSHESP